MNGRYHERQSESRYYQLILLVLHFTLHNSETKTNKPLEEHLVLHPRHHLHAISRE